MTSLRIFFVWAVLGFVLGLGSWVLGFGLGSVWSAFGLGLVLFGRLCAWVWDWGFYDFYESSLFGGSWVWVLAGCFLLGSGLSSSYDFYEFSFFGGFGSRSGLVWVLSARVWVLAGALCLGLAASFDDFNESPLSGGLAWVLVLGLWFLGFGLGLVWSGFGLELGLFGVFCTWVWTFLDDFTTSLLLLSARFLL